MLGTTPQRKRGLFGAPIMFDYNTPPIAPPAVQSASPDASPVQVEATVPTYKKPSIGNLIIGTIGDTLSQLGGGQGNYLTGLQRQQGMAQQAQQQQANRAAEYADWVRKEQYKAANPGPQAYSEFERALIASGVQPGSPEWAQKMGQKADMALDPQVTTQLPNGGLYIGRQSGLSQALGGGRAAPRILQQLPPGAKPLSDGGAPRGGARTFPIR